MVAQFLNQNYDRVCQLLAQLFSFHQINNCLGFPNILL